jgi:hypothetical protein
MNTQIDIKVIPLVIYVNVATTKINAGKNLTTFHCTQKNIVH